MEISTLYPRVYERKITKSQFSLYQESANSCNATQTNYKNGMFYAEFESHSDFDDFARTLQARNLPF